jgi:hypothetical protein
LKLDEREVEEELKLLVEEKRGRRLGSESRRRYVGEQVGSRTTWKGLGRTKQAGTFTFLWHCISYLMVGDASY